MIVIYNQVHTNNYNTICYILLNKKIALNVLRKLL